MPADIRVLGDFHAELSGTASGLHEAGEQWAADHYGIGVHEHPGVELYLQVHGTTHWDADSTLHRLAPGQLLVVPPRTRHAPAGRPSARHHFLYAGVDLPVVLARRGALAAAWSLPAPRCVTAHPGLEPALRTLVREVAADGPLREEGLAGAVDLVVLEAARALCGAPAGGSLLEGHACVQAARRLIEDDPSRPWTLSALAAEVGLSPTYLAERFTREVGQPPHQYLVEHRLERARGLLRSSDLPITTIALEVGFGSSQHFARVFRRSTGRTPGTYRREGRSTEPPAVR